MLSAFSTAMRAALAGQRREALDRLAPLEATTFTDGEGLFYVGEIYAWLAEPDRALATLTHAVAAGFLCVPAFERSPLLAKLRGADGWPALIGRVRERQAAVARMFTSRGGRPLLGLGSVSGSES
jgi:hypothetical protein